MPFVTTNDYPAIRALLDVTITPAKLPDATIAQPPYHPAAEAEVARRLSDVLAAVTASSDATARAQAATLALIAARILPALPNVVQRRLGDTTLQLSPSNVAARVRALRAMAAQEINAARAIADPTVTVATTMAPVFTVATGGRAQQPGWPDPADVVDVN